MAPRRVLVADDEYLIAYTLSQILRRDGVEVTTVDSAEEALAQVGSSYFDICFLDRRFPGLDGLEALPFIKEASPKTRVVFMTGTEVTPEEQAVVRRYADFFMDKPFDLNQVRVLVERILDERRYEG